MPTGHDHQEDTEFRSLAADVAAALPAFVAYVGRDYRFRYVNRAYEEFFGLPTRAIVGKHLADVLGAERFLERKALVDRALAGEVTAFDATWPPRDATAGPVHFHGQYTPDPQADADGQVRGVLLLITDVTKQKDAERALAASEERYRYIVENTREGVCLSDADGAYTFVNGRFGEMLGREPGELLGTTFRSLMAPEDLEAAQELFLRRRRGESGRGELRVKHEQGHDVWVRFESTALTDGAGAFVGSIAIVYDVTEERRAREEQEQLRARLLRAEHLASIGTLATGVGHEVNNPLTFIVANLEALAEAIRADATGPLDLRAMASMIQDALDGAERVTKIVRGLKAFSRPDEDARRSLEVRQVLDLAIRMTSHEIRPRARLSTAFGPTPLVHADEARLGQVFVNLLVNAAQAIGEGAPEQNEIAVVARTDAAGRAVVEIRDTGPGIPEEIRARIFDPFFTTKPIGEGTGLGLSICHGIVKDLGGEIDVEPGVGGGTTFRVTLPASRAPVAGLAPESQALPAGGRRGRVLVVDDDRMVGRALGRILGAHDVDVAFDGREALDLLKRTPSFDLILCDLMMPGMTGMDLYTELSRAVPDMAARMVFMSGGGFTETAQAFLDRVPNPTLEKPIRGDKLRALVRRLVG